MSISVSKLDLFPPRRKASPARAKQIAKFAKFRIVIVAVVGERLLGGLGGCVPTGEAAPLPPGPPGSGVDGRAALPLLPRPRSPPAEPSRGFNCDRLKHTRSLQCTFMTRAFAFCTRGRAEIRRYQSLRARGEAV